MDPSRGRDRRGRSFPRPIGTSRPCVLSLDPIPNLLLPHTNSPILILYSIGFTLCISHNSLLSFVGSLLGLSSGGKLPSVSSLL